MVILGTIDLVYTGGSVFGRMDLSHVAAGAFAVALMGLALLQIRQKREQKLFSLTQPTLPVYVLLYLAGLAVAFRWSY
ncbi:MAG: hypothetical protein FJ316_11285 [SAR202 cluster bacterium]|nr:hypothetical protein [SAR202 cluster bacterium]